WVWLRSQFDARDPLHPFEAPPSRRNEPQRRSMIVRKRVVAHMRRQERLTRLVKRQAPAIARHRDEADIARVNMRLRQVEQTAYTHATPALRAIEAAGTVEQRHQLVESFSLIACV